MLAILLTLIFIRPFISSLGFVYLNLIYSIILLGFLTFWLIHTWIFRKDIPLGKIKALRNPLILLLLALLISIIFSTDNINSLRELYKYISGLLIFLVAISLSYEERIRVIKTIILGGFLISLLAIYQYFFGFHHVLDYLARDKTLSSFALDYIQRKRVFFPFVTPNTLAGYLAMIIPLILVLWDKQRKIFLNPLLFFLIPVAFALFLTQSLGALISLFLALGLYFYLPRIFGKLRGLQGNLGKKRILLITGLMITIGLVFFLRQMATKQHILPVTSLFMRLNYWIDTLRIIKTAPLQGLGLGNFNLVSSRYAHNSYLQIWAEMGIVGIASFLWLILIVFKSALKNFKDSLDKQQIAGLITASTVFLIHNFVDFSFFLPEVALIWWIILGLSSK